MPLKRGAEKRTIGKGSTGQPEHAARGGGKGITSCAHGLLHPDLELQGISVAA